MPVYLSVLLALLLTAAWVYRCIMWPRIMTVGSGPVRVSCVGDSITFGQGVFPFRRRWSYQAVLSRLLGPAYTFVNYGLTNRTLLPLGKDQYFQEATGRTAWNTPADILIFMLGTNDSKLTLWDPALFERTYLDTLAHYQQMGCFRSIYIMIPPRVFDEHPGKRDCNPAVLREQAAPIIRRVAQTCGVHLIDLYALTEDHREWFPDKLHPNRAGNQAIAEEIARQMRLNGDAAA